MTNIDAEKLTDDADCAHTMTMHESGKIVCCDCGRRFRSPTHVEQVQWAQERASRRAALSSASTGKGQGHE